MKKEIEAGVSALRNSHYNGEDRIHARDRYKATQTRPVFHLY